MGLGVQLKDFFREHFRSKTSRLFTTATELVQFGTDAAIPSMEVVLKLDPNNREFRSTLAVFYAAAGTERMYHVGSRLLRRGGWTRRLSAEYNTKPLLSAVRKVMRSDSYKTRKALDEALGGALGMFDKALEMSPDGRPNVYSPRARAYRDAADYTLVAYDFFPTLVRTLSPVLPNTNDEGDAEGEIIRYGDFQLGICYCKPIPKFRFSREVIRLYEWAEQDYQQALMIDPTDAKSYAELSELLVQFGRPQEAEEKLYKSLAILNGAIRADDTDVRSYSERAEVYERLGEIDLAIADWQKVLALETSDYSLQSVRDNIDRLHKRGEASHNA